MLDLIASHPEFALQAISMDYSLDFDKTAKQLASLRKRMKAQGVEIAKLKGEPLTQLEKDKEVAEQLKKRPK